MTAPPRAAAAPDRLGPAATAILAWIVPGGGHVVHGQARKGAIFFVVLVGMFGIGLASGGRLFPFQIADVLVFLAAGAEWLAGLPRLIGALAGAGRGDVVAATYEYGNAFLIAGGLLNLLVILDAVDLAAGRKAR
ncbi:MAG: DUF6677 family protein [Vicinamibacterales bacterium]